jgi:type IV pilus assembly protein PilM
MRREEDRQRTIIFVDIGHRDTTAVFGRSGEICFVKQIPFGVACFSEEAAEKLGLSVADVASLRYQQQQEDSVAASTQRSVVDALTAAAEPLAKELSLCLRYHTVTFRGKRVERAVIAGGGAYEKTLLDVLRHHLSVEIEVGEPLRGFDLSCMKPAENGGNLSADLALAVGLSLKGGCVPTIPVGEDVSQSEPVLEGELQ